MEKKRYYPFGLTMAGISSKAAAFGEPGNKFKYNGIIQNHDFDLNTYDAFYRTNDPQIARWLQIDPKPFPEVSPYCAMGNNPIALTDCLGDTTNYYNRETGEFIRTVYGSGAMSDVMVDAGNFGIGYDVLNATNETIKADAAKKIKDPKKLAKIIKQMDQNFKNSVENLMNNTDFALGEKIDMNSDLGHMIRAVYAEMRGGDNNAKAITAESIENRSNLPVGSYERADGTYEGIVSKFYDVSKKGNAANNVYNNPYSFAGRNPTETAAWANSVSASIKASKGLSNVGQGVIFYNSTSATYYDKNPGMQKIQLNITVNGVKGLWKLKN